MTDVSVAKAVASISGDGFDLEATVVCGSSGKLAYQLRTFDKSGDPADLKIDDIHGSMGKIAIVRIDDKAPYQQWDFSRFSNQVLITGRDAANMAAASKLVLRFRLVGGDETYSVDQSNAELRAALQSCMVPNSNAVSKAPAAAALVTPSPVSVAEPSASETNTNMEEQISSPQARCWTPPSGPNVIEDPERTMSFQEVEEIEHVTGRAYQSGDSIYGRVEDRCPA